MIYLSRHLRYLVDPLTGADLAPMPDGVYSALAPHQQYRIQDEVLYLAPHDLMAQSQTYDAECRQAGKQAPSPDELMALPRQGLEGWGSNYWESRAVSMAGIWEYLEAQRRKRGGRCVGFQGAAAVLSPNLPYIAYGLEAGGYATYALSPHVGAYGLGAYREGRYGRVQVSWAALPLRPHKFELVILSEVLPTLPFAQGQIVLRQAVHSLAPTGYLMIVDSPNADSYQQFLQSLGLHTQLIALRGLEDNFSGRLRSMLRAGASAAPPLVVGKFR